MLDFNIGNFDAPGGCLGVDYLLDILVEFVSLREHLIKLMFSKYRTTIDRQQMRQGARPGLLLSFRVGRFFANSFYHLSLCSCTTR